MGNFCKKKGHVEILEKLVTRSDKNEGSEIFLEYFQTIKQIFLKNHKENRNNQINISVSLDKRDFDSVITSKKVFLNKKQKYVYWKDYLLRYLNRKVQNGYVWAEELSK